MQKLCFVTTGATAPFIGLIESILSSSSLDALLGCGISRVLVQYGTAKSVYETSTKAAREYLKQTGKETQLEIDGMDFDSSGLSEQFTLVQKTRGLVVSHAGKLRVCPPHPAWYRTMRCYLALRTIPSRGQVVDNI